MINLTFMLSLIQLIQLYTIVISDNDQIGVVPCLWKKMVPDCTIQRLCMCKNRKQCRTKSMSPMSSK